jgi:hypothetical protein
VKPSREQWPILPQQVIAAHQADALDPDPSNHALAILRINVSKSRKTIEKTHDAIVRLMGISASDQLPNTEKLP